MAIKSEIFKGKIFSGSTQLASSIVVTQSAPMQLTISAGSFTTTGDKRQNIAPQTYILNSNNTIDLISHSTKNIHVRIFMGLDNGIFELLEQEHYSGIGLDGNPYSDPFPDYPINWVTIHPLVFEFVIPPNTMDLSNIDIFVLTVENGFPVGTTQQDWLVQNG